MYVYLGPHGVQWGKNVLGEIKIKNKFKRKSWMNTTALLYPHNGILLSNKKNELLIHTSTWTNLKMLMLSEPNRKEKYQTVLFHWNKFLGDVNESMWQKQNSGSPEDRWEEQSEGRRVDIIVIHHLDGCGGNFMVCT